MRLKEFIQVTDIAHILSRIENAETRRRFARYNFQATTLERNCPPYELRNYTWRYVRTLEFEGNYKTQSLKRGRRGVRGFITSPRRFALILRFRFCHMLGGEKKTASNSRGDTMVLAAAGKLRNATWYSMGHVETSRRK